MDFKRKESTRGSTRGSTKKRELELLPTGCTIIDCALGGGLPFGKQTNIVGDRSGGKTILACEIIANAIKIYGDAVEWEYDDAENGFSIPTMSMYGYTAREIDDPSSKTVEELEERVEKRIKELAPNKKLIYVVDTVEGLQSEAELKHIEKQRKARESGKEETGTYGTAKAKYFNQFLRGDFLGDPRLMLLLISQTRDKIGVTFGSVKTRHCEQALEYWSDVIIYLRVAHRTEKVIEGKTFYPSRTIEAMIKKNKIIGYELKPMIRMTTGLGIDNVDTNVCFLFDLMSDGGKVKSSINVEYDGQTFKTRDSLIKYIETENLEEDIHDLCCEKWERIMTKLRPTDRKKRF